MNFDGDGRIQEVVTPPSHNAPQPPLTSRGGAAGEFSFPPLRVRGGEGELTYEEQLLLALLKPGMENAGSVKYLAGILKLEEVTLRERIRHLIMEHGVCIGSNTNKCPGYYLILSPEELDKNYVSLRRRGIKILMRAAELKKISLEEVFHQGVLSLRGTE
jgi:hypothetical protein